MARTTRRDASANSRQNGAGAHPSAEPARQARPAGGNPEGSALRGREPSPFARLIEIMRSNEWLFQELQDRGQRLNRARQYLTDSGCQSALGLANLEHARAKHQRVLILLRANRLEALQILGRPAVGQPQLRG